MLAGGRGRAWWSLWAALALGAPALGQGYGLGGPGAGSAPLLPGFQMEYALPRMHKWYVPRQLPESYLRPWYDVEAGYARQPYSRYVDRLLEGDDFVDGLGNPVGRGWLVYSWSQQQPQPRGSLVVKQPTLAVRDARDAGFGFDAYRRFFSQLVIAADGDEGGQYRLMIGDEIHTVFTPLTLYKPRFDGVRLDYSRDRWQATLVASRVSDPDGARQPGPGEDPLLLRPQPGGGSRTHATHLLGGHAQIGLGPGRLGLSFVSLRNADTQLKLNNGNPLTGTLTASQDQPLRTLWVRLRDDSPLDRGGGAVLLDHEIVLTDTAGRRLLGSQIGLVPIVEGGLQRGGALVAEGGDFIQLEYDLEGLSFAGPGGADEPPLGSAAVRRVQVRLNVADDYRVETASDRQTDGERLATVVFLPALRASGNVRDRSNAGVVAVDYGLPVASQILGVDWDLPEWKGLSLQGEVALNRRYRRYPNPNIDGQYQAVEQAAAAYANAAYRRAAWQVFVEAFSIDDDYSTSYWLTSESGVLRYSAPVPELYELVDDDDDLDGLPEWERPFQPWKELAWPGFDENGDFLNDYNQNDNLIPDYDEPFLRYGADRPSFLFGLDMNHNGAVDRLENDAHPDYPYRTDHRGFNAYIQGRLTSGLRLLAGWQRFGQVAGDGRTRSLYGLALWTVDAPGGRLRLALHGAEVEDDIADDRIEWQQPVDALGFMRQVDDALPGYDAWKGGLYADWRQRPGYGVRMLHRFKADGWRQRSGHGVLQERGVRRWSGFVGMVNKAEWSVPVGLAVLQPRLKSEWRRQRPLERRRPTAISLEETFILLWSQPIFAERVGVSYFPRYGRQVFNTQLQLGVEASAFWLLDGRLEEAEDDFVRWTGIAQLVNRVAYEGYQLVTRTGLRLSHWNFAAGGGQSTSLFFMTVNAGLR